MKQEFDFQIYSTLSDKIRQNKKSDSITNIYKILKDRINLLLFTPFLSEKIVEKRFSNLHNEEYYIIKNSRKNSYLRLSVRDYFIFKNINGKNTLEDIVLAFFLQFGTLATKRVVDLCHKLRETFFLADAPINIYQTLFKNVGKGGKFTKIKENIKRILIGYPFSINSIDPIFNYLFNKFGKILFSKFFVLIYTFTIFSGITLFISQLISSEHTFFKYKDSFSLGYFALIFISLFVIFVHEFAHGITTKYAGARVNGGGFLFYFGLPCFFIDTTDVWISTPLKRILVSLAGPISTLLLGSISSIILAFIRVENSLEVANILFKFSFLAYLSSFFNLNPLLELDGYYVLSDIADKPSLRQDSLNFIKKELFIKFKNKISLSKEEWLYSTFGLLSSIWAVVALVITFLVAKYRLFSTLSEIIYSQSIIVKILSLFILVVLIMPIIISLTVILYSIVYSATKYVLSFSLIKRRDISFLIIATTLIIPIIFGTTIYSNLSLGLEFVLYAFITEYYLIRIIQILKSSQYTFYILLVFIFVLLTQMLYLLNIGGVPNVVSIIPSIPFYLLVGMFVIFILLGGFSFLKNKSSYFTIHSFFIFFFLFLLSLGIILSKFHSSILAVVAISLLIPLLKDMYNSLNKISFSIPKIESKAFQNEKEVLKDVFSEFIGYAYMNIGFHLGNPEDILIKINKFSRQRNLKLTLLHDRISDKINIIWENFEFINIADVVTRLNRIFTLLLNEIEKKSGNLLLQKFFVSFYDSLPWEMREICFERLFSNLQYWHDLEQKRDDLFHLINQTDLFSMLNEEERKMVVNYFREERVDEGTIIVKEGDIGDLFYIILSGEATVYKKNANLSQSVIGYLRKGDYFGEIALIKNVGRTATVIANRDSILLVMSKDDFIRLIKPKIQFPEYLETNIETLNLLKNIPILSEFSSRVIGEISKKMVERRYRVGELIIKEGDLGREFYVIAEGRVRVVKSLGEETETAITKLGEGEFFGEIALIHDAKRASSVIAIDDCKLMVLSKENFDLFIKRSGEFHKRVESVSTRRLHTMKT